MKFEHLILKQLDKHLKNWNAVKNNPMPTKGWVNLIRNALGMSTRQLAKRMAVNQSRVIQIENAELDETVTLKTLKKAAEAMGCRLVYAIVPNTTLYEVLLEQAKKIAAKRISRVSHSMDLEAQKISPEDEQEQVTVLINELMSQPPKKLWAEN